MVVHGDSLQESTLLVSFLIRELSIFGVCEVYDLTSACCWSVGDWLMITGGISGCFG